MHARSLASVARAVALAIAVPAVLAPLDAPLGAQGARGEGVGPGGTFPYATIFVSTGASLTTTVGINKYIRDGDYYAVSNDAISYGGGVRGNWGRFVAGGEYAYADYGEEGNSGNGRNLALKSRYYLGQVGYAWYAGRHLNVYPLLGVGAGTVILTLSDRNGGGAPAAGKQLTFPEVVLHPNGTSELTANYLLFEPAIGADWLVLRSVADRFGVSVGARLGKRIAPNRATWKLNDTKVIGGPDAGPDGTFFRLTIGIGWR